METLEIIYLYSSTNGLCKVVLGIAFHLSIVLLFSWVGVMTACIDLKSLGYKQP